MGLVLDTVYCLPDELVTTPVEAPVAWNVPTLDVVEDMVDVPDLVLVEVELVVPVLLLVELLVDVELVEVLDLVEKVPEPLDVVGVFDVEPELMELDERAPLDVLVLVLVRPPDDVAASDTGDKARDKTMNRATIAARRFILRSPPEWVDGP